MYLLVFDIDFLTVISWYLSRFMWNDKINGNFLWNPRKKTVCEVDGNDMCQSHSNNIKHHLAFCIRCSTFVMSKLYRVIHSVPFDVHRRLSSTFIKNDNFNRFLWMKKNCPSPFDRQTLYKFVIDIFPV